MRVYDKIKNTSRPLLAVLIDPDKAEISYLEILSDLLNKNYGDIVMVGGSITFRSVDFVLEYLKKKISQPIILYPGSPLQVSFKADALLFLSLISGRNPEYLIGHHISVAKQIKDSGIEVIPTGYMLIEGGKISAVEYISNTKPIPSDNIQIATATAIAGELLGMKLIYLEAGSGSKYSVPIEMIRQVKRHIDIPLIVGGGIKNEKILLDVARAGANIIVVGTAIENNVFALANFSEVLKQEYNV